MPILPCPLLVLPSALSLLAPPFSSVLLCHDGREEGRREKGEGIE